jgi:Zn finger protein HypA/HybF involved in hydrogenase expression
MKNRRAELSFEDSLWVDAPDVQRTINRLSQVTPLSDRPLPQKRSPSFKVVCNECGRRFSTRSFLPTCPGCGGSDVEPA